MKEKGSRNTVHNDGESALTSDNDCKRDNHLMNDEIVLSKNLKRLMKKKKLTFKRLSETTGVSQSTLKDWSNGTEPRSFASVRKVARALEVSTEHLVFGDVDTEDSLSQLPTTQLFSGWAKITIELPVKKENKNET